MKSKYLCLILLSAVFAISGQQPGNKLNQHVLGLTLGINQVKDEMLAPVVHSGLLVGGSYEFRRTTNYLQSIQLAAGFSRLKTDMEDLAESINFKLNLSYNYCFMIAETDRFIQWFGPEFSADYTFAFFQNWDDSHLYWADKVSLGIHGVSTIITPMERTLQLSLSIPVISFFSRPDAVRLYKIDDVSFTGIGRNLNSNMTFGLWNKVFRCRFSADYLFQFFKTKQQAVVYNLDLLWISKKQDQSFKQLIHALGLRVLL